MGVFAVCLALAAAVPWFVRWRSAHLAHPHVPTVEIAAYNEDDTTLRALEQDNTAIAVVQSKSGTQSPGQTGAPVIVVRLQPFIEAAEETVEPGGSE